MYFSHNLIPTCKESPSEAEIISHKLMLRAGLIRRLATGIYIWLPIGLRVLRKIEFIIRDEMNKAGACEILMPGVQPASLWKKSGRWSNYGRELLRLKDYYKHEFCLAPTHEEVVTDLARREIHSYRDMPLNLYQIQTKFRDEIRPRFGVIRAREFIMKDSYSFDIDEIASTRTYNNMYNVYCSIFKRIGLRFSVVEADTGSIGGAFSHEFIANSEIGEDIIVNCINCGYASNLEKVEVIFQDNIPLPLPSTILKEVITPNVQSIDDLANYLKIDSYNIAKTIIYIADSEVIAAMVRGDREVNEFKLKKILGVSELVLADSFTVQEVTKAPVGFTGPCNLNIPIYADQELFLVTNLVIGGNKVDSHYVGFHLERDLPLVHRVDIRYAVPGDLCFRCNKELKFTRGIEVGHIFRLGTKYSAALGATYLDIYGQMKSIVMGCYGIGISRIVAAVIEQNNDKDGIIFPMSIAPLSVYILPIEMKGKSWDVAKLIYDEFYKVGVDVLLDDRDVRPGIKFKDSDLLGIPLRLVVGTKNLNDGKVELQYRFDGRIKMIPINEVVMRVQQIVKKEGDCFFKKINL